MKKRSINPKRFWLLVAGALAVGFAGCSEKEPEVPNEPFLDIIYQNVVNNNLTLKAAQSGDEFFISVNSSRDWKMDELSVSWLKVTPTSGEKDKTTPVTITVDANPGVERSARLLFKTGDGANQRTVSITQYGDGSVVTGDLIYFEDLGDFKSGTTIRNISGVASPVWPTVTQYGSADPSSAWRRGGEADQSAVTYSGTAQVRNSGEAYDPADDSSISGAAYIVVASGQEFVIGAVKTGGATNLTFSFAGQNTVSVSNYIPTFGTIASGVFSLDASFDGTSWAALTFTAQLDGADWYIATSEFKVPDGTDKLYFRFSGFSGSSLRLDDFSLAEGGGGALITPGGGGDGGETTIAAINASITDVSTPMGNYTLKAVVTTDMATGNFTSGSLSIMTEGAATAGNGILLYCAYGSNMGFTDGNGDPLYESGDEIEVDLSTLSMKKQRGAGALADDPYCNEIIIPAGTVIEDIITKTGRNVTITPITITYDQIADYQDMLVKIEGVQSEADNITVWAAGSTNFTYQDDASKVFPAYVADAADLVGTAFSTKNGPMTGIAYVYPGSTYNRSQAQITPRSQDDLAGLTGDRIGAAEYLTVTPQSVNVAAAGGVYTVDVSANVAWTAEVVSGNTAAISAGPTPANGNTDGTVSLTFDANGDTGNKTLTLRISTTVDVETKTYDVEFTQRGLTNAGVFSAEWNFATKPAVAAVATAPTSMTDAIAVSVGDLTPENFTGGATASVWGTSGVDYAKEAASRFATVTFEADPGFSLSLTSIEANLRRSGTGAPNTVLQYRLGTGEYVDITDWTLSGTTTSGNNLSFDLSGVPGLQNVAAGTAVTIRFVPYGGTGSAGTWYLNGHSAAGLNGLALTITGSAN